MAEVDETVLAHIKELLALGPQCKGDRLMAWLAGIESLEDLTIDSGMGTPRAFANGDGVRMANGMTRVTLRWALSTYDLYELNKCIDACNRCYDSDEDETGEPEYFADRPNSAFWNELTADEVSLERRDWAEEYTNELEEELYCMLDEEVARHHPEVAAVVAAAGLTPVGEFETVNIFDDVYAIQVDVPLRPDRAQYAPLAWRRHRTMGADDHSVNACEVCHAGHRAGDPCPPAYYPLCPDCSPASPSEGEPELVPCTLCGSPTILRLRLCLACRPHRAPKGAH